MESKHIIIRLKLLTALPMILITIGFTAFLIKSYSTIDNFTQLKQDVVQIKSIANMINELQRERGISSGYIGSHSTKFQDDLLKQRTETDRAFYMFIQVYPSQRDVYLKNREELLSVRNKIDKFSISNINAFDYYMKEIEELLNIYLRKIVLVKDRYVKRNLQSDTSLAIMKESLGQIRGAFNGIFSLGLTDNEFYYRIIYAKGIYDVALHRFESSASPEIKDEFKCIVSTSSYKFIASTIDRYHKERNLTTEDPNEWWNKVSIEIDKLYKLEIRYFQFIDQYVTNKSKEISTKMMIGIVLFSLLTFFILWLGRKINNSILRNISLLNEYKDAVDRSSIVSKTNVKGVITYANDKFCSISGYRLEELIGKPHNIIRHTDMPKEAFREMWNDILHNKSWSGIVKNRKKDGGSYTVEATISPILNHKGEIEEFIAIRNDITGVISLHEELENTQKDLIYKMSEIVESRSMETGYHVRRVAEYSKILAQYYGLDEGSIKYLVQASPMHDIGKVAIPDSILNKPDDLTEDEWKIMQTHAKIGYDLFKDSNKPLLEAAATIAHEHHEKYDGTGYPRGLKGEEIHIFGRITALADVLDALGSDRVYKHAWDEQAIEKYIREERAKHFDPDLVDIFFAHLDEFIQIKKKFNDTDLVHMLI